MIDFLEEISLRSKSAYKTDKYLLIKLLILGQIGLYKIKNLKKFVPKALLRGFHAISEEIWEIFWSCFATNDGE